MFNNAKNSKKQGDIGLGVAIAYFASQGNTVLLPISDSQDYDLVVDVDGELLRVQVRTASHRERSGNFSVALRVCGGNSKINYVKKTAQQMNYDLLFAVTADGDSYLIPKNAFPHVNTGLTLSGKFVEYKLAPLALG